MGDIVRQGTCVGELLITGIRIAWCEGKQAARADILWSTLTKSYVLLLHCSDGSLEKRGIQPWSLLHAMPLYSWKNPYLLDIYVQAVSHVVTRPAVPVRTAVHVRSLN